MFNFGLQLALPQEAHAVLAAADHAGGDQGVGVDRLLGVELAGFDGVLRARQRFTSAQLLRGAGC